MISRRAFLGVAGVAMARLKRRPPGVGARGFSRADDLHIEREYDGAFCKLRVINRGKETIRLDDVIVLDESIDLPSETALYGEGFQMLTQTGGTLASPVDLSQYTDAKHYRLASTDGARAFYGLLTLSPPRAPAHVFAFTSCARFSGRFEIRASEGRPSRVVAIVDCEGLMLRPGATLPLEELMVATGDRPMLLDGVAARLARSHPPLRTNRPPTGWCSWYCFGPNVTASQVLDNLDVIAKQLPSLKYIQIDDGYQSAMGDWLETGAAFGGSVRAVLADIRRRGFEPAIWVAPFIAEEQSLVFRQHPAWFITDAAGAPLRSDRVTFGGWRHGPWYAIDGTHPEAQAHLERVFRTMRQEWGCSYFKLDANFWGAMHGGRFRDPDATRVDAYRRGMRAIGRGAGDAFLLGCNHPIWPSVGTIHGSRSSNDIKRSWDRIATTARQNLARNWQNGRLWWNDPDAVVLAGDLTDAECQFHATAIYASGGMVLSGDDLTKIPPARAAMLRKLLPPAGVAATFLDSDLRVGSIKLPHETIVCMFNWDDHPSASEVKLGVRPGIGLVSDFWTGEPVAFDGDRISLMLSPRSARLLKVTS